MAKTPDFEYDVNTHPDLDPAIAYWIEEVSDPADSWQIGNYFKAVNPRDPKNPPKAYWGTKMNFYWFGTITDATSMIIGGMYDPNDDNKLVYGAIVDCGAMKWMTVYQNSTMSQKAMWKEGSLWETCEAGQIFDLIFEMSQPRKGSFIFNGQPLEDGVYPKVRINRLRNTKEGTGQYHVQKLPVKLTLGTKIKGTITGGVFTRYAYGKCFAFPRSYLSNCTLAKDWVDSRNKLKNIDLEDFNNYNDALDPYTFTKDDTDLASLGMNNIYATITCLDLPEGSFFSYKQSGIHADHNTDSYPAVCCAYMNGTLADSTCESYKTGQYMACYKYTMWMTKYEGLEEYYVREMSEEDAADRMALMQGILNEFNAMPTTEAPAMV